MNKIDWELINLSLHSIAREAMRQGIFNARDGKRVDAQLVDDHVVAAMTVIRGEVAEAIFITPGSQSENTEKATAP